MKVLVLNSGSSSQKSCLYEIGEALPCDPPGCLWEGKIEWVGDRAESSVRTGHGVWRKEVIAAGSRGEAIERLLGSLWNGEGRVISGPSEIEVVGHRVVHGGPRHFEPALATAEVKSAIESVSAFAPLHNRAELEGMQIVSRLLGAVAQVAVFDTGFHRNMPRSASTYPGPYEWFEQGIRRYGFHGINHQYCAERAARLLAKELKSLKLVSCHLGNGCSLAAIRGGESVDTTMGFTPLEGLMMGTRSGSVDPGILTYLVRQKHLSGEQLDTILNQQSGLLGVSGLSSDMREIQAAAEATPDGSGQAAAKTERARLALEIYVHRLRSGIGAMTAVLDGVDALIFTAGVGENSPEIRAAACQGLSFFGVQLDAGENARPHLDTDRDISAPEAAVRVLVIHAQEDWMIARQCWSLMRTASRA
jgi:acetate kinase